MSDSRPVRLLLLLSGICCPVCALLVRIGVAFSARRVEGAALTEAAQTTSAATPRWPPQNGQSEQNSADVMATREPVRSGMSAQYARRRGKPPVQSKWGDNPDGCEKERPTELTAPGAQDKDQCPLRSRSQTHSDSIARSAHCLVTQPVALLAESRAPNERPPPIPSTAAHSHTDDAHSN